MAQKTTILLIFYCVCFVQARRWSGANYWTSRYGSDGIRYTYDRDSNILWNSIYRGGHRYEPPQVRGRSCFKCICTSEVIDCSKASGIVHLYNMKHVKRISGNGLSLSITSLTIRGTGLETIHQNAFKNLRNLKTLVLIKNKLTQLPDLSNCTRLETLNVYDNNIDIPAHKVIRLPRSLKKINFIKNKVRKFPDNIFKLPNLEQIALSHNRLKSFPKAAFSGNTRLKYLAVDGNQIKFIWKSDFAPFSWHKSRLQHLNLSNNAINGIEPYAVSQLTHLKILELHNNLIGVINSGIFKFIPNLLHIDMTKNIVVQLIAGSFEDLPRLKVLLLHSQKNPFQLSTVYYNSIKNLPSLEQLWLSNNKLIVIPFPMLHEGTWAKLKELYLDHNRIRSLSEYSSTEFRSADQARYRSRKPSFKPFDTSRAIEKLYLHNNLIRQVGALDLALLRNLKFLELKKNHIASLNRTAFRNNGKLRTLYLQQNRITKIENGCLPASLVKLDVSTNRISLKDSSPFRHLANLQTLYLAGNGIEVLPNDALHGLSALRDLYLGRNKISRLLKVHLRDVRSLAYLTIDRNSLSYIEPGTFNHLRRLVLIQLSSNHLRNILPGTFSNLRVWYLYFDGNNLTTIKSNTFVGLPSCSVLSFKNNSITAIETNAFKDVKCSYTYFTSTHGRRLRSIATKAFNKFSGQSLYLEGTGLINLPRDTFYDVNLNNLYLQNSLIANIEEKAFRVSITGKLDLKKNKLQSIKSHIFHPSSKVKTLNLGANKITNISKGAFSELTSLQNLYLNSNKLKHLPTLGNLRKLEILDVSSNKLETIGPRGLLDYTSIFKIYLNSNRLKHLPTMGNLRKLKILYLNSNKLKHLPTLGNLRKLEILDVSNNKLETIGPRGFLDYTSISKIVLTNNSITCNCVWYQNIYPIVPKVKDATCSKPSSLRGYQMTSQASMLTRRSSFCGPKSTEAKPSGAKTTAAKPPGPRTTAAKPPGPRTTAAKPPGPRTTAAKPPDCKKTTTDSLGDRWRRPKLLAQGFFIVISSQPKLSLSNELLLVAFYFPIFVYFM